MPGLFSTLQSGASYVKSVAGYHMGNMSATGKATAAGAAMGAGYGAYSDNTSMLGGMAMGAGMGRYGYAAGKMGSKFSTAIPGARRAGVGPRFASGTAGGMMAGAARGAYRQARRDASSAASYLGGHLRANRGFNPLRGIAPGV